MQTFALVLYTLLIAGGAGWAGWQLRGHSEAEVRADVAAAAYVAEKAANAVKKAL